MWKHLDLAVYSVHFVKTEDFRKRLPLLLQPLNISYEMEPLTYILDRPCRSDSVQNPCVRGRMLTLQFCAARNSWKRMLVPHAVFVGRPPAGGSRSTSFLSEVLKKITNGSLFFVLFFRYMCVVTMYIRHVWILSGFVIRDCLLFLFLINVPFLSLF